MNIFMEKKGFTLVELLVVITILGILMSVASISVVGILNREKNKLLEEMEKNLSEAAIAYIQSEKIMLKSCSTSFDPEHPNGADTSCYREISVQDIANSPLFTDDEEYCDRTQKVMVYKYNNGNYTDLRAYVKKGTCN